MFSANKKKLTFQVDILNKKTDNPFINKIKNEHHTPSAYRNSIQALLRERETPSIMSVTYWKENERAEIVKVLSDALKSGYNQQFQIYDDAPLFFAVESIVAKEKNRILQSDAALIQELTIKNTLYVAIRVEKRFTTTGEAASRKTSER